VCVCMPKTNPKQPPVLRPLYRSTCVSRQLQLTTRGFCWCKVSLPTCPRIREKMLEFSSTVSPYLDSHIQKYTLNNIEQTCTLLVNFSNARRLDLWRIRFAESGFRLDSVKPSTQCMNPGNPISTWIH